MSPIIIDAVGAFFRGDTPHGISLSVVFDGTNGNRFSEWCESLAVFLDGRQAPPGEAIAWLTDLGRKGLPHITPTRLGHAIIGTIHWLERREHIESDEYNGVIWSGTRDGAIVAIRHDPPTPENVRMLRQRLHIPVELRPVDDFETKLREFLGTPPSN